VDRVKTIITDERELFGGKKRTYDLSLRDRALDVLLGLRLIFQTGYSMLNPVGEADHLARLGSIISSGGSDCAKVQRAVKVERVEVGTPVAGHVHSW
jgi:hypothetical protein